MIRCLLCMTSTNKVIYNDFEESMIKMNCSQCIRRTETFGSFLSDIYEEFEKFTKTNKADKQYDKQ